MRKGPSFLPVFKREVACYLQSPGTYVALAFFFLLSGAFFTAILWDFVEWSSKVQNGSPLPDTAAPLNVTIRIITQMFSLMNFLMLLIVPALTMWQVAEERKSGSFELLVTMLLELGHPAGQILRRVADRPRDPRGNGGYPFFARFTATRNPA